MATKVLLTKDVLHLGRQGEIYSVRPGFARNYLFPQQLAVVADTKAMRMQERLREERRVKSIEDRKEAELVAQKIDNQNLIKSVKVDHEGHLYGSVSVLDILHLVEQNFAVKLEKGNIQLKHPIKEVGIFSIPIKLKEDVHCSFTLKVISEEAAAELAAENQ